MGKTAEKVLAKVAAAPGISERELKDAIPFGFVDGALEELHDAGQLVFDVDKKVYPASEAEKIRVAPKVLVWGGHSTSGGGLDALLMTQAVREHPKAAAFELRQLREQVEEMKAAQNRPPRGDMLALAKSFPVLAYLDEEILARLKPRAEKFFDAIFLDGGHESVERDECVFDPMSPAEQEVIRFLWMVWNGGTGPKEWERHGKFDVYRALGSWSSDQRTAFIAWCQEPWWM